MRSGGRWVVVDAQRLDPANQAISKDAEQLGSGGLVPFGFSQRLGDHPALDLFQHIIEFRGRRRLDDVCGGLRMGCRQSESVGQM